MALCEGTVEKFSMGRSTGLSIKNWKTRHLLLSKDTFQYSEKQGAAPKHVMHPNAISVVWTNPTPRDHPKAGPNMFMVRVWSNGVFDLLVNCITKIEHEKWITSLRQLIGKNKGVQFV
jgi:hypothetical protein